MEYNQLVELIKTVSESNLTGFRYEEGNVKIHMSSGDMPAEEEGLMASETDSVSQKTDVATKEEVSKVIPSGTQSIHSPLVGTFYAAPSEDAEPFVKVGDRVKKGQVVGIVEAMKLMNEIESEYDGVITEILVDNATGVEYGEALFVVE